MKFVATPTNPNSNAGTLIAINPPPAHHSPIGSFGERLEELAPKKLEIPDLQATKQNSFTRKSENPIDNFQSPKVSLLDAEKTNQTISLSIKRQNSARRKQEAKVKTTGSSLNDPSIDSNTEDDHSIIAPSKDTLVDKKHVDPLPVVKIGMAQSPPKNTESSERNPGMKNSKETYDTDIAFLKKGIDRVKRVRRKSNTLIDGVVKARFLRDDSRLITYYRVTQKTTENTTGTPGTF